MSVSITVHAEWQPPLQSPGAPPITGYVVQFDGQPPTSVAPTPDPGTGLLRSPAVTILDLNAHQFTVSAVNQFGTGPAAVAAIAVSLPALPQNVTVQVGP